MALDEIVVGAVAGIISKLGRGHDATTTQAKEQNGIDAIAVSLPGPSSVATKTLEHELSALASRIRSLEIRAIDSESKWSRASSETASAPRTPFDSDGRPGTARSDTAQLRDRSGSKELQASLKLLLSQPEAVGGQEQHPKVTHLTEDQAASLGELMSWQAEEIRQLKDVIKPLEVQVKEKSEEVGFAMHDFDNRNHGLERELAKRQQAITAFSKALREIGEIVTNVAAGDLSKKVLIHSKELDPEIETFKKTINRMVDQLQEFASQVSLIAKEVGTEGRLGRQANLPDVRGIWAELTSNVNVMAENLTGQVREIAVVTTAVAHGDLSKKIERPANGEIAELQNTINVMVEQLRTFATELNRVAKEVGTEGTLGGQAQIQGVQGIWNDLTINVNAMANNLTTQVRDIAKVTTAVAKGNLSQKVTATCKGEILDLKTTINSMVDQLQQFAKEVTNLAQEVGTEGRLGIQATVHGVEGTWGDLTQSVNVMAMKLTTQVREIAQVTTAVAQGDLSKKVEADVKGEVLALKNTINNMVDQLGTFAFEVSKVAREVGTEGTLGGQAKVENVEGKWKDLTDNVNTMAQNLTEQVRGISEVTQAISQGDMTRKIGVQAQGEILLLTSTINDMVSRLDSWSSNVRQVAKDVGVEGRMGGQARVDDISGRWKEITLDVNTMAQNLTGQVRAFAEITAAANSGDFTHEITIPASGEMDELKRKINTMVSGLRDSIEKNTKARETAELANKTKSEFLANMSHEIRTPMNGIIGMTQLTLDSELTTYQRDMLNTVYQLANSLLTIIDDILDISKIEANRMDIEKIPFSIRGTIYNALKSLVVKANDRGLNLAYQVDSTTLDYVIGDSFRLRQIIMNLVGNAIKFTEAGEVRVSICHTSQGDCRSGEYAIKFAVSDTGIGIHQDNLEVIFDTFQQADGSTTRRFGGTGLGLSISRRLVKLLGGEMGVSSRYGQGSTFFFTCKVQKANTSVKTILPSLAPYRRHTVLFIDQGNTGFADEICEALRNLDLTPLLVREDDERFPELPSANGQAYDCVIVDNNETARALRKIEKFKYIPIVLLAPLVSVGFKSALEDGISSYMTTPCLPIDLANALIPALEGRASPLKSDQSRSFSILLAEDNQVNQRLAVRILEKYQHTVTVANNGQEAYDAVKSQHYDVILMDVQMPIMGGFEATAKIREWERQRKLPRTPILALTAHAMLGDREKCLQAEMDDYLSKPLKQTHLIQYIVKYATMSGAMLEHKHKSRRSLLLESTSRSNAGPGNEQDNPITPQRPGLGERGFTDIPHTDESPSIVTEGRSNPFDRFMLRSHSG